MHCFWGSAPNLSYSRDAVGPCPIIVLLNKHPLCSEMCEGTTKEQGTVVTRAGGVSLHRARHPIPIHHNGSILGEALATSCHSAIPPANFWLGTQIAFSKIPKANKPEKTIKTKPKESGQIPKEIQKSLATLRSCHHLHTTSSPSVLSLPCPSCVGDSTVPSAKRRKTEDAAGLGKFAWMVWENILNCMVRHRPPDASGNKDDLSGVSTTTVVERWVLHMRSQAPTVEACRSMPQHLFLGPVGGCFEACRSMLQHTDFLGQKYWTKISISSLSSHLSEMARTLVVRWCICDCEVYGSIPGIGNLLKARQGQGHTVQPVFFLAVLCFGRLLFSSLCVLMSTVEPIEELTTQPKRNKETTRSTTDCLQWAIGESIGQYLCCTDTQGEGQNGKL